jgi:hypothetical protein
MKLTVDLPDIAEVVAKAVEEALKDKQSKLEGWEYYTLKEVCELLQIKSSTLLDKRMPFINELEYSQSGRIFWFKKKSVETFISNRNIRKYKR